MLVGATITVLLWGRRWWRECAFALLARARWRRQRPAFPAFVVMSLVMGSAGFLLLFPTLAPNGKRGKVSAREQALRKPFLPARADTGHRPAALRALALTGANPTPADQFTSAFSIGGNEVTQIGAAGYDTSGNLYVTGGFQGTLELTVNAQPVTLTASQDMDFFLAKFNANHQCLWVRTASGATNLPSDFAIEGAIALAVDMQGNAYVGGGFVNALTFKDSQGTTLATLGDSDSNINLEPFVAKFAANGAFVWAKGGNSGAVDKDSSGVDLLENINAVTEIVVDGAGNPYVAGLTAGERFLGTTFQGRGAGDIVLARLQPANGNVVWLQNAGGARDDGAMGLAIDKAANVYVIGYFLDIARFPTSPPTFYDSLGYQDTFVSKFDANGQCLWVKQIGGQSDIFGSGIAVDEDNNLYLTGTYLGEANFGATKFDSPDNFSGFLVKMNADSQILWARSFGGTADSNGDRVALDRQGQVFVLGTFESYEGLDVAIAQFGQESLPTPVGLTTTDGDLFLAKYTRHGEFRWARGVYGTGDMADCEVCADGVSLDYLPLRLLKHPLTNDLQLFGDFQGTLTLSDNNLTADLTSPSRVGFAAKLMHNCPSLAFSALPSARVNETYNAKITLTTGDNPARFAAESTASLPPGLTLANDGTLSGTPTQPGTYTIKVNGTDAYDCGGSNTYQLTVSTYEADVAPRQTGNGAVSVTDWTQVGRFIIGLDSVQASEFQRVDCAPRATQGDGQLNIGDWVQAGRYAAGLDSNVYAAGPAATNLLPTLSRTQTFAARLLSGGNTVLRAVAGSEPNTILIQLEAGGGENAFGFNLTFDPAAVALAEITPQAGLSGGAVLLNETNAARGSIGVLAGLPGGQAALRGLHPLLKVRFIPVGAQTVTPIRFADGAVKPATADATAQSLPTSYINAELPLVTRVTRSDRTSGRRRDSTPRGSNR